MRLLRLAAALPLVLLGLHCAAPSEDVSEDEAAHTAERPVTGNSTYFWATTDYDTFRHVAQAAPFKTGTPLDASSPLPKRLQAWADRIHAEVAKDVRARLHEELVAPPPVVVVVPATEANAWVSGIPACFTADADLRDIGTPGRPARTANLAFASFDEIKEAVSLFGAPPPDCAKPENWKSLDEAIAFFNASGAKCKLTPSGGGRVKVGGEGCKMQGDAGPTAAKQLTFYATSPYVHFTTAMIALAKDEHELVGIVAHELGHYYRAHAVSDLVMNRYNYWYEQKERSSAATPRATADSADLAARFDRVMPYPMPVVEGQRVSYRLTPLLVGELATLLDEAKGRDASFACAPAASRLGDWRYDFGAFGASFVKKDSAASYLAYEAALLECAPRVKIAVAAGASTLALAEVRDAIERSAHDFARPEIGEGTLADAIAALHARASTLDKEAGAFLETVRTRRLGKYTAEQEADDFSLEYFARAGLAPRQRIDGYLDLIVAHAADSPERFVANNGGLDVPACEALVRADFQTTNAAGQKETAFVPLGNLHDPHHGDCYRLFNMSRELAAHRFRAGAAPPSFAGAWADVRREAQRLTDAFVPIGPMGPFQLPAPSHGAPGGAIVDGI
jgi:hypothetical protein